NPSPDPPLPRWVRPPRRTRPYLRRCAPMTSLTLFDPDLDEASLTTSPGGAAPAEVASAEALPSFRATKHKSLNFVLGVDSTALVLAILHAPTAFGIAVAFSDFSIVPAMTGFEFPDTIA